MRPQVAAIKRGPQCIRCGRDPARPEWGDGRRRAGSASALSRLDPEGTVKRGRLGAVCQGASGAVRYRCRAAGAGAAAWGRGYRPDAITWPGLSGVVEGGSRWLADNDAATGAGELCRGSLHARMGHARATGHAAPDTSLISPSRL